jgi:hypothetical protein
MLQVAGNATLLSGRNYTESMAAARPSLHASVVFLKIQDFARRPASEQARLRAQLYAVVAVTAAELAQDARMVLDAADGVAIVVLDDPRGALQLAQRALTAVSVGLPLSAGLNHGALQLSGRKGGEGIIGDGLAVAASVAEFAAPPKLLASRAFRDALAEASPGTEAALVASGTFTDPGLRTHELFAPDVAAPARRNRRFALAGLLLATTFVAGGVAVRSTPPGEASLTHAVVEKVHDYVRWAGEWWMRD